MKRLIILHFVMPVRISKNLDNHLKEKLFIFLKVICLKTTYICCLQLATGNKLASSFLCSRVHTT